MTLSSAPSARRSTMIGLFVSAGLSSSGYIAAIIIAPLVAEDMLGSPKWSGLPFAMGVIGMAFGATNLSNFMVLHGRRAGLLLGYGVVMAAAAIAALATSVGAFWLFTLGMFAIGVGHSANRLTRYAAADLYPPKERALAISWIIWAGTIGSVLGPALLEPMRNLAARIGIVDSAGPFFVTIAGAASAALVLRAMMPRLPAHTATLDASDAPSTRKSVIEILALPNVQIALVALAISQGVMVLLMTMTPVYIRTASNNFGAIGLVIAAHAFGMYALSPLTGYLADRLGRIPIILTGVALLIISTYLAANAEGLETTRLTVALFILGLGWNFGFVAGSALLTDSVQDSDRIRLQGLADSLVWTTAAGAGLSSGVLLATWNFSVLSLVGTVFSLLPILIIGRHRLFSAT